MILNVNFPFSWSLIFVPSDRPCIKLPLILVSSEIMERAHKGDKKCKLKEGFLIPIIKGWSTELAQEVTSNGLQIHGGMGFTQEMDIHLFVKRAHIHDQLFGGKRKQYQNLIKQSGPIL